MKKLRWQLLIIFLTGLVVGFLLLAEQPGADSPFQSAEPEQGGIYTEALVGNLQRLNPLFDFYNPSDRDVDRLIFSGLVRFDARGIAVGDLADSWGVSQDGTLYNFTIRPKAVWHDGSPVTADDVIFTIDLLRNGGDFIPADLQAFWKEVDVKGQGNELQFQLPEPFAPFLDYLSIGILPKHLLGALPIDQIVSSPFNLQPVGSGPFQFDHAIVEDGQVTGVSLRGFEDYYGQKPYLEQLVLRYYPDGAAALQAYRDQQVQGISQIPSEQLNEALSEPNLAVYSARRPELSLVLFNLKNKEVSFLEEVAVRRALFLGLNRQKMVDTLLNGQGIVANGPIFPGTWAYHDGLQTVNYDPQAAENLLKEAGYLLAEGSTVRAKENTELSMTLLYPDDDAHRALAEAIKDNWSRLNVQVELEAVPYDELIATRLQDRDYQAALVDINYNRTPDPDPYPFWDQVQANNGQNYSQWGDKVASDYLEQARVTTDLAERTRLYRNFQVIFADQLPALPLYYPVYNYGVDRQVMGVRIGPLIDASDRYATVVDWHLADRPAAANASTSEPE